VTAVVLNIRSQAAACAGKITDLTTSFTQRKTRRDGGPTSVIDYEFRLRVSPMVVLSSVGLSAGGAFAAPSSAL
jgi:hypothetical protein